LRLAGDEDPHVIAAQTSPFGTMSRRGPRSIIVIGGSSAVVIAFNASGPRYPGLGGDS